MVKACAASFQETTRPRAVSTVVARSSRRLAARVRASSSGKDQDLEDAGQVTGQRQGTVLEDALLAAGLC